MTDTQLQLVAPLQPEAGATQAPDGPSAVSPGGQPSGAIPPRPSTTAILVGYCRDCGRFPKVDPLTMTTRNHKYPKWGTRNLYPQACPGAKTIPDRYAWLEPLQ